MIYLKNGQNSQRKILKILYNHKYNGQRIF